VNGGAFHGITTAGLKNYVLIGRVFECRTFLGLNPMSPLHSYLGILLQLFNQNVISWLEDENVALSFVSVQKNCSERS
jgi:hypothetical protein